MEKVTKELFIDLYGYSLADINRIGFSAADFSARLDYNILVEYCAVYLCICTDEAVLHNDCIFNNSALGNMNASEEDGVLNCALDDTSVGNKGVADIGAYAVNCRHIISYLGVNRS